MAKMYPQQPEEDAPASERVVFASLKRHLPDDYVVFHGQRLNMPDDRTGRFNEQEADFIMFHPRKGYLVMEVKGGGIRHDEQGWWSMGNNGEHPIKDPGAQAQGQAHAINAFLKGLQPYRGATPRFGWAVCFPDVQMDSLPTPELPRECVVDGKDLAGGRLESVIAGIFDRINHATPAKPYDTLTFIRSIAPTVNLVPCLSDRFRNEELDLVRMTQEQKHILDFMGSVRCAVVRGGAGTGKTVIALERARRLATAGADVLMLCYNQPLSDYLAESVDGVRVSTFHGLAAALAAEAGLRFEVPADMERQRVFWQQDTQYLLDKSLARLPNARWDHVIIDEGQDFHADWWTSILDLRRDESSSLWVMLDPNQSLYYGCDELMIDIDGVPGNLVTNCRNSRRIAARLSELIPESVAVRLDAPEGAPVVRECCANQEAMLTAVRKALHELLNENGIDPNATVVLSPRLPETSAVWERQTFGNWRLRRLEDPPEPNTVRFCSIPRFKGLEADAVILCEVRPDRRESGPLNLYVGSSRAKHLLYEYAYEEG